MNNAVMVSIQPKWCELIANFIKEYEIRKSKPNIDLPFKVYIYCTLAKNYSIKLGDWGRAATDSLWLVGGKIVMGDGLEFWADNVPDYRNVNGQVIGEFVCDKIYTIEDRGSRFMIGDDIALTNQVARASCLDYDDMKKYAGNKGCLYAWHISDLKIYKEPKELCDFYRMKKCNFCKDEHESITCAYKDTCTVPTILNKPPQSWQYVEELV